MKMVCMASFESTAGTRHALVLGRPIVVRVGYMLRVPGLRRSSAVVGRLTTKGKASKERGLRRLKLSVKPSSASQLLDFNVHVVAAFFGTPLVGSKGIYSNRHCIVPFLEVLSTVLAGVE